MDNRKFSFNDCWRLTQNSGFLTLAGAKLLGIRIDFPSYLPEPRPLQDLIIGEQEIPGEARLAFEAKMAELANAGFRWPIYHTLKDQLLPTQTFGVALLFADGSTIAKLIYIKQVHGQRQVKKIVFAFVSPLTSGRFLCTGAKSKGFASNPRVLVKRLSGQDMLAVYAVHQRRVRELQNDSVRAIQNSQELVQVTGEYENLSSLAHIASGVYQEVSAEEIEMARRSQGRSAASNQAAMTTNLAPGSSSAVSEANSALTSEPPPAQISESAALVQLEIARQQNPRESWKANIWLLVFSAVIFAFSFKGRATWKSLGILMLVLLIHELGHYAAMKWFGYKNVRMFFLPFFGAAVSGKRFGVDAWRKAAVSLMGPVPGIIIGSALMPSSQLARDPASRIGLTFILLNLFNLVPILPLDGGWFWHSLLFSRNRWADLVFRALTALVLIVISLAILHNVLLAIVGVFMLLAMRNAYYVGRIAEELRKCELDLTAQQGNEVPPRFTEEVIQRFNAALPKGNLNAKQLAQTVLDIYDRVTIKSAGLAETTALIIIYGAAIALAIVAVVLPLLFRVH
jgi:Zn-dependent protease